MKVITKCEKSQGKGSTLSDWSAVAEMNQTRLENTFGRKLQPTKSRAKLHFFISHSRRGLENARIEWDGDPRNPFYLQFIAGNFNQLQPAARKARAKRDSSLTEDLFLSLAPPTAPLKTF